MKFYKIPCRVRNLFEVPHYPARLEDFYNFSFCSELVSMASVVNVYISFQYFSRKSLTLLLIIANLSIIKLYASRVKIICEPKSLGPFIQNIPQVFLLMKALYFLQLLYEQLKGLINPEVDEYKPSQMKDFWYLFNNDDYVMSKLFEDEAIFPTILGNCRNLYATEQLLIPFKSKT